jgi:putative tryptophan/tyrosine transport system substrate-binding protein
MRRRGFIRLLGGAVAWPLAARAQQPGAIPLVGILGASPALTGEKRMMSFRQGLAERGFVEGKNLAMIFLRSEGNSDRLPDLAEDLVRRQVSVIVVPQSAVAAIADHKATKTLPIVFSVTIDPVKLGLVASLARPGGNATGVNNFSTELTTKRLGLLKELVPTANVVAALINPANPVNEAVPEELQDAARETGLHVRMVHASSNSEIDTAFDGLARDRPDALLVVNDSLFTSRNTQIVLLAARHALPAIYSTREYADVGGLMSYGTNLVEVYRQIGSYTGRILQGESPANLPVVQSTKFELVINLQSIKLLGLATPPMLLARADEVIE